MDDHWITDRFKKAWNLNCLIQHSISLLITSLHSAQLIKYIVDSEIWNIRKEWVKMDKRNCVGTNEQRVNACNMSTPTPTVPQKGVIFVKFQMFPWSILFVFMINLDYSTHVFSEKTFLFQFLCDIWIFQFLDGQKRHKMQHFPPNLPVLFLDDF